jgi:putative ABC transport system substrate-binding protein
VLRDAAHTLHVDLQILHVQHTDDLERAFAAMKRERAEALFPVASPFFSEHRERLLALTTRGRLPAMYADRSFVEAGGLMSYGEDLNESFRRAATFVDKILKGAKPADLPVEQPTKFVLAINLKTAKALGLTIPPSVLGRADEVIQ